VDSITPIHIEESRALEHHDVAATRPAIGMASRIIGAICLDFGQGYLRIFAFDFANETPTEQARRSLVGQQVEKGDLGNGVVTVLHRLKTECQLSDVDRLISRARRTRFDGEIEVNRFVTDLSEFGSEPALSPVP
jgi:hypothetical protein